MLPYGRQSISEDEKAAVLEVLDGDWLTTGPSVDRFEAAISNVCGGHAAVSVTSGTAALHVAYKAAGIGLDDTVITTPMTFIATASCASILGANIKFADIDEETGLIDPQIVDSLVDDRTKVISGVDYAGQTCDYKSLQKSADKVGALTLADAAHSIGGTDDGRPVGDLADVTTLSFFPTKNMTTGEGGAVITRDQELAQKAREFRNIGLVRDPSRFEIADQGPWHQEVHDFGLNYRLTDIACAIGIVQLEKLARFKKRREEITQRYNEAFSHIESVKIPVQRLGTDPVWHLYPLRILDNRRREVYEQMRAAGIGVQVNYIPVYWHPIYRNLGFKKGLCPKAEEFYSQELSLPIFPDLSNSQIDQIATTLIEVLK